MIDVRFLAFREINGAPAPEALIVPTHTSDDQTDAALPNDRARLPAGPGEL